MVTKNGLTGFDPSQTTEGTLIDTTLKWKNNRLTGFWPVLNHRGCINRDITIMKKQINWFWPFLNYKGYINRDNYKMKKMA